MLCFLGLGHSAMTVMSGGMLAVDSGAAVAAHSAGSTAMGVAALEHWASASRIVACDTCQQVKAEH
jgi:hypothetical protein